MRTALRFVPVETVDQVFTAALCPEPLAVREETPAAITAFAPVGRGESGDGLRQ